MRRVIRSLISRHWRDLLEFGARCIRALRYMRHFHYSAHLAWVKAAR